jgi:hypothetical protein
VWCLPQAQRAARKAGLLDELMAALTEHASNRGVQKAARALMTTIQVEADDEFDRGSGSRNEAGIATLSIRNPNYRYHTL